MIEHNRAPNPFEIYFEKHEDPFPELRTRTIFHLTSQYIVERIMEPKKSSLSKIIKSHVHLLSKTDERIIRKFTSLVRNLNFLNTEEQYAYCDFWQHVHDISQHHMLIGITGNAPPHKGTLEDFFVQMADQLPQEEKYLQQDVCMYITHGDYESVFDAIEIHMLVEHEYGQEYYGIQTAKKDGMTLLNLMNSPHKTT